MSHAFDVGACSEQGRRDYQQDAVGRQPITSGLIAAVADGVGSYEGSDLAAQVAVRTMLQHHFWAPGVVADDSLRPGVEGAVADAHLQARQALDALGKPGATTLALLLVVGERAVVAHVGDSRVYRLRAGKLEQLTEDHRHPFSRHTITRSLGSERATADDTAPDVVETDVRPGDVWLLSTDGVHDSLTPEQLAAVLADGADAQVAAQALVESALAAGSRDNCTALVVRVPGDAPEALRGAA
ncbi:PP2C family protein-serine/threonine phosphatase [Corallococcus carmarthensis]|uniref:Serine/threonine-protein phosphatase n=1 Tax=Corallococcus carmarthensis TaxID=2316728 RepID=A0A3A8K632_9BACT|nr:PP2C family serine/threonine-protein phosphatase [Corallococcus carmarthensis]RKH02976.1 serine/threonine-protein phosphatase [Corallococcus carmarthensis]